MFIGSPPHATPATAADVFVYMRQFGLEPDEVTVEQLAMFVVARNAGPYVEPLERAVASRSGGQSGQSLAERELDEVIQHTAHQYLFQQTQLPADEMEVGTIDGVEDLPRLFPTQWLMEEIQPTLFYHKLAERELLTPVWQQPSAGYRDAHESAKARGLVDDDAPPDITRQHAYVLLDVSGTMNDHDRRGPVARGLALAFLRHGQRGRRRLHLRSFTDHVGPLHTGGGKRGLGALARRIISIPNGGQTRIQGALEHAVRDVRGSGPCRRADIMLITDGISRLTRKPHCGEILHTFILGDLADATEEETATIAKLRDWSDSFERLSQRRFAKLLAPKREDVQAGIRTLQEALNRHRADPNAVTPRTLKRLHEHADYLLKQWQRPIGRYHSAPDDTSAFEQELNASGRQLPSGGATERTTASRAGPVPRRPRLSTRRHKAARRGSRHPGRRHATAPAPPNLPLLRGLLSFLRRAGASVLRAAKRVAARLRR